MSERLAEPSLETPGPRAGVRLQTRGVVQSGALYVARRSDEALVTGLRVGRWSVVLGPRFSGKSSLRVRTARTLREPPDASTAAPPGMYRCATIEARALPAAAGGAVYLALCNALASELRLPAVSAFWQQHGDEPPVQRFRRYLRQEVVTPAARTVILVDDLDALQTSSLDLPELLRALEAVRTALEAEGNAGQLTLVFFSTVPLERLAETTLVTTERLLLPDFTRAELAAFGPALAALVRDAEPAAVQSWVDAVFSWTAGHPQLTQHLCQQLVARAPSSGGAATGSEAAGDPGARVERLVRTLFLEQEDAVAQDPCLREMVQALTRSAQAAALIALYRRLLAGVPVTPDPLDAVQRELRLCGLASEADDPAGTPRLRPRCQLVTSLLDDAWARAYEVRLSLQEATARESALLRGVPLKTAQAWARKNPAALRPPEVRVLLASLEAARSEAEAKHQASAAALQRERRDKSELRYPGGPAGAPAPSSSARPVNSRAWRLAVALGLFSCLAAAAWANAQRRATRFAHAAQEATARATRAEQALRMLQSEVSAQDAATARAVHAEQPPPILPSGISAQDVAPAHGTSGARIAASEPARTAGTTATRMTGPEPARTSGATPARTKGAELAHTSGTIPARTTGSELAHTSGTTLSRTTGSELAHTSGTAPARTTGSEPTRIVAASTHAASALRTASSGKAALPVSGKPAAGRSAGEGSPARQKTPRTDGLPDRHAAARAPGMCPDPVRPVE